MANETVARRYASAMADVAISSGQSETVKTELSIFQSMLTENRDLWNAFSNPAIAHLSKSKVLETLIERSKPSTYTANFLRVLLKNSRISNIGEINEKFESVLKERSGLASASVVSARPLSEKQQSDLKTNLEKMSGKTIDVIFSVDETLIGGFVARLGSTVYDSSVKTRLEELREQLVNN